MQSLPSFNNRFSCNIAFIIKFYLQSFVIESDEAQRRIVCHLAWALWHSVWARIQSKCNTKLSDVSEVDLAYFPLSLQKKQQKKERCIKELSETFYRRFSEAVVPFYLLLALPALHIAAPIKLAVTPLHHAFHLALVAPAAAKNIATLVRCCPVARAARRTRLLAEIRAGFQV